jgi:hypothetical protein
LAFGLFARRAMRAGLLAVRCLYRKALAACVYRVAIKKVGRGWHHHVCDSFRQASPMFIKA